MLPSSNSVLEDLVPTISLSSVTITPAPQVNSISNSANQDLKRERDPKKKKNKNNNDNNGNWNHGGNGGDDENDGNDGDDEDSCQTTIVEIEIHTETKTETKVKTVTQTETVIEIFDKTVTVPPTTVTMLSTVVSYQTLAASARNSTITYLLPTTLAGTTVTQVQTSVLSNTVTLDPTTIQTTVTAQAATSAAVASSTVVALPDVAASSAATATATTAAVTTEVVVPLSTGSVAGIVVGGLAGFYFLTYLIWNFVHRRKPKPIPYRPRSDLIAALEKSPSQASDIPLYIPASMQQGGAHDQTHLWAQTSPFNASNAPMNGSRTAQPLPVYQQFRDLKVNNMSLQKPLYIPPPNARLPQERFGSMRPPSSDKFLTRTTLLTDDINLYEQHLRQGISQNPYSPRPVPEISTWSPETEQSNQSLQSDRPHPAPDAWSAGDAGLAPPRVNPPVRDIVTRGPPTPSFDRGNIQNGLMPSTDQRPDMSAASGPPTPWFTGEPGAPRPPNFGAPLGADRNVEDDRPLTEWFPEDGERRGQDRWAHNSKSSVI